ncbi:MAG: DUF393 domain-containing protein [Gemmatimonadetes bacterium]|nr:DUF393 domain-containing protein [Gemmatimonadota bacterium]MBK6845333.1 DUF393 domain-containing protein [Gemmatimonadota bacterium]MBK8646776.1 DUF393 domain-containing protein [Gemmatimonadota bacterium]MBK9407732.1 DUF393 domain-containing protein [Gemmatimonadota bacterium]MBK9977981.1 DUF393 domain-containing protein [Gemmatimonadota bacterium]
MPAPRDHRPSAPAKAPKGAKPSRQSLTALLEEHGLVLLYDGECGLCDRTVQWVLKRDREGSMRFAPLKSAVGREALARLPGLANVDSVILVHREGAWIKSTAVLELLRYVGGAWAFATAGYLLPRALRDWCYDFVARRRIAWFGRLDSCRLPSAEDSARFLMTP